VDRLTPERRSWNISRIRGRDTGPERQVRSMLHGLDTLVGVIELSPQHSADIIRDTASHQTRPVPLLIGTDCDKPSRSA
jgi:G:T-mismatch repair DNA endonuclease (very short patch repair protein)